MALTDKELAERAQAEAYATRLHPEGCKCGNNGGGDCEWCYAANDYINDEISEDDEEVDPETESDFDREQRIEDARADYLIQQWKDGDRPNRFGKYRGDK